MRRCWYASSCPLGKPHTITARMGFILSLQQLINCVLQIVRFSRKRWWGTARMGAVGAAAIPLTCVQNILAYHTWLAICSSYMSRTWSAFYPQCETSSSFLSFFKQKKLLHVNSSAWNNADKQLNTLQLNYGLWGEDEDGICVNCMQLWTSYGNYGLCNSIFKKRMWKAGMQIVWILLTHARALESISEQKPETKTGSLSFLVHFSLNEKLEEQQSRGRLLTRVLLALRAPFGLSFTPQVLSLTEAHLLPIHLYMKAEVEMMHSPLCNDTEPLLPVYFRPERPLFT